jgi:hypothetical protein
VSTLNDMADTLIDLLADKATQKGAVSPYMTQSDLMDALGIRSHGTMSDVVTRAALRVTTAGYPGYAILRSKETGYRLGDKYTVAEITEERTRLKAVHTKVIRSSTAMLVNRAGVHSRMVGKQLAQFAEMVVTPAIEALDDIISSN